MSSVNLTEIFGKFAGRKLLNPQRVTRDMDPVLQEMDAAARKNGLELRMHFPGRGYTDDYDTSRINAYAEKTAQGGWRVVNKFNIG